MFGHCKKLIIAGVVWKLEVDLNINLLLYNFCQLDIKLKWNENLKLID